MLLVTFLFFQDISPPSLIWTGVWGMKVGGGGLGGINSNGQLTIFFFIKKIQTDIYYRD